MHDEDGRGRTAGRQHDHRLFPKGGQAQAQSDPNDVKPDVRFTFAGIEPVSVPAGTYAAASKYTVTTQGLTSTYWTAPGVPGFVKFQVNTEGGPVTTELNGWG
jgi:hypothetical protein